MEDSKPSNLTIRIESSDGSFATSDHLQAAVDVGKDAFDGDPDIETILRDANVDPTALPLYSLLAYDDTAGKGPENNQDEEQPIGHVLFTAAKLDPNPQQLKAAILAPLGVRKEYHKRGVGNDLGQAGLKALRENSMDVCFVLGWPQYYPRFGFAPADQFGFATPFPEESHPEGAWMVLSLNPDKLDIAKAFSKNTTTNVICCNALNKQKYWMAPDQE